MCCGRSTGCATGSADPSGREALAGFVGKSVIYCESWRPRYAILATVLAVDGDSFTYYYKSGSGSGSGGASLAELTWLGEAQWIGG